MEIVSAIQELAETEGVFTETAGGVTTAVTARLYAHGRNTSGRSDGGCITGNGLKTTDVLAGRVRADMRRFVRGWGTSKSTSRIASEESELELGGAYVG